MQAFHSFWSKPNSCRNNGIIELPDFELLTAVLSALEWKKHNGPISMITDTPGAEYFDRIGIAGLWDAIDVSLDQIGEEVDPMLFWAAGKLFALKSMKMPAVMLDTDLIVWEKLCNLEEFDIVTAHDEDIVPYVYPDQSVFQLKNGYGFPEEWDFNIKAANTAFLYLKESKFRDAYVDAAITFMSNVGFENLNPVTAMCFAEQRILPMIAKKEKKKMGYLLDREQMDVQTMLTHTWGYKSVLQDDVNERYRFCRKCVERIQKDFPELTKGLDKLAQP